jgi:hypothetical protein
MGKCTNAAESIIMIIAYRWSTILLPVIRHVNFFCDVSSRVIFPSTHRWRYARPLTEFRNGRDLRHDINTAGFFFFPPHHVVSKMLACILYPSPNILS